MISIILPIYNASEYLETCFKSILNQTLQDFEILCIDDGSRDNSLELCTIASKRDSRFRVFTQKNSGVSVARNVGIVNSLGDFIVFIDSDDQIDKRYLEVLMHISKSSDLPICSITRKKSSLGKGSELTTSFEVNEFIRKVVLQKIKHPGLTCMLFRTSIIKNNSIVFTPGCTHNEDFEFYMRYVSYCNLPIISIDYVGYYYCQNLDSAMHKFSISNLSSLEASQRIVDMLIEKNMYFDNYNLLESGIIRYLVATSRNGNKELYNYIHSKYNVPKAIKAMRFSSIFKLRCVSVIYSILGEHYFYKFISHFYHV